MNSLEQFFHHLDPYNNDDLPDGAWFAVLENEAERLKHQFGLSSRDCNDLVHEYLEWKGKE